MQDEKDLSVYTSLALDIGYAYAGMWRPNW